MPSRVITTHTKNFIILVQSDSSPFIVEIVLVRADRALNVSLNVEDLRKLKKAIEEAIGKIERFRGNGL